MLKTPESPKIRSMHVIDTIPPKNSFSRKVFLENSQINEIIKENAILTKILRRSMLYVTTNKPAKTIRTTHFFFKKGIKSKKRYRKDALCAKLNCSSEGGLKSVTKQSGTPK